MFKKTPNLGVTVVAPHEQTILSSPPANSRQSLGNFMCRSASQCIALLLLVCLSPLFLYRMWRSKRSTGRYFKQQQRVGRQHKIFNYLEFNDGSWWKSLPLLLNVLDRKSVV